VKQKNDTEPRDLYSIRGFQKKEYDPMIPSAWFVAPPISFEGNGKEIEALRVCFNVNERMARLLTLYSFNTWLLSATARIHTRHASRCKTR
jgi:hypothetical protein